jgi:hypothetical protein
MQLKLCRYILVFDDIELKVLQSNRFLTKSIRTNVLLFYYIIAFILNIIYDKNDKKNISIIFIILSIFIIHHIIVIYAKLSIKIIHVKELKFIAIIPT